MRAVEKTESAFEAIQRLILNGSIPPGAPLRVATLSKALNISATPVREALARLEENVWQLLARIAGGASHLCLCQSLKI
jgi:DNA-binding GntR family transcriptional regulator